MNIEYELEEPFHYSWNLVYILLVITIILIGLFLLIKFAPFFSKILKKIFRKTSIPGLKIIYIAKLGKLKTKIEHNSINNRDAYIELSSIIREFIKKSTGINVLSISKEEAKKLNIKDLSLLMEEYYPPEFSKNDKGNITMSINKTMEVIKRWN